jgi:alkaline phosphatase D
VKSGGYVKFMNAKTHGYISMDVTPQRMQTRFQVVSDRKDRNATVSTLKAFVVESGKAGAVDA